MLPASAACAAPCESQRQACRGAQRAGPERDGGAGLGGQHDVRRRAVAAPHGPPAAHAWAHVQQARAAPPGALPPAPPGPACLQGHSWARCAMVSGAAILMRTRRRGAAPASASTRPYGSPAAPRRVGRYHDAVVANQAAAEADAALAAACLAPYGVEHNADMLIYAANMAGQARRPRPRCERAGPPSPRAVRPRPARRARPYAQRPARFGRRLACVTRAVPAALLPVAGAARWGGGGGGRGASERARTRVAGGAGGGALAAAGAHAGRPGDRRVRRRHARVDAPAAVPGARGAGLPFPPLPCPRITRGPVCSTPRPLPAVALRRAGRPGARAPAAPVLPPSLLACSSRGCLQRWETGAHGPPCRCPVAASYHA